MVARDGGREGRPGSDTSRRRAERDVERALREALGDPAGVVEAYFTPFGIVGWAPEAAEQPTALWLAGGAPARVHGALKRLLLTLARGRHAYARRADAAEARLAAACAGGRN